MKIFTPRAEGRKLILREAAERVAKLRRPRRCRKKLKAGLMTFGRKLWLVIRDLRKGDDAERSAQHG